MLHNGIIIKEGCTLSLGERIECYYNKTKKTLAIRSIDKGRQHYQKVVAYSKIVHLEDVEFYAYVNKTSIRKVIKGYYAGNFPIIPKENDPNVTKFDPNSLSFLTSEGKIFNHANYCVCFEGIILAEDTFFLE